MKLPDSDRAIVDDAKVRDYLLSREHPVGRFKARVFITVGYRREDWRRLKEDFLAAARTIDVEASGSTPHGQRYAGATTLISPTGVPLPLTTVWLIRSGEGPRFLTAYPRNL